MQQRKSGILVLLFILGVFLSQCSIAPATFSQSDESSGSTTETVVGGNISAVTVEAGSAVITPENLDDSEHLILMLFAYSSSSSSAGFQVGSSSLNNSFLLFDDADQKENTNLTHDLHSIVRGFEQELEGDMLEPQDNISSLVKMASVGTQRNFKVLNSFSNSSSFETVTATLRYQTEYFEFYVDNRNADDLEDSELEEMAEDFADIIPTERGFYGMESDVDGNGKFAVLFTQTVNELGASAGGMVTGFFYAADLFDESQYPISNEMEIFYTFVPDPYGDYGTAVSKSFGMSNIYPGVLPHEYQHMISFNRHYNEHSGSVEESWLNEALSHLSEDIHSLNSSDYMTTAGLENPARVAGFLEDISDTCFSCGTSLYQRGGSYLFIRYLYEQAENGAFENLVDGEDLLNKLLDTSLTGVENVVTAVYGEDATEDQFKDLLGLFGLAIYLSNSGESTDSRFGFEGINLRATQDDNRGTVLNGPSLFSIEDFPFTDTITGTSLYYMEISAADIIKNGGSFELSVSSSADFGGYLIRE